MIEGKRIPYEDLIKLYDDKCKYCETLEERLQKANKRNDDLESRVEFLLKKFNKLKTKHNGLYEFAEGLIKIIEERDKDIKELINVNEELIKVNEQLQSNLKTKAVSQISILEILRHL